jgi:hypothetical protein
VAKRQGAHRKARMDSRNQPFVKKVVATKTEEATEAPAEKINSEEQ